MLATILSSENPAGKPVADQLIGAVPPTVMTVLLYATFTLALGKADVVIPIDSVVTLTTFEYELE
jgi:hypothetical protein